MPIANEYNPQLVLVAAGFDAALGDPLGGKIFSDKRSCVGQPLK
jgi:acetoin utilization deacetylase AcuC-like enzyme